MQQFEHILRWRLTTGSHPFPGPDGGTCINEAAVVAAGFPYQSVRRVEEMPRCFSRPICRLAMILNDEADDAQRQRLLPFVTRLSCADEASVEREREVYIAAHLGWQQVTFDQGLRVLAGALAIGRQAEPLGEADVRARLAAACSVAQAAAVAPASSLVDKLVVWFRSKETEDA
ncbi:hypothetical protein [Methylobacterium oryzisoli]|uniref:hypothetical protein n=1 Tax=Methylobacterium oryzisoli TaxID=3385502 RepID=UPI0038920C04